jgi:hypothetical protein
MTPINGSSCLTSAFAASRNADGDAMSRNKANHGVRLAPIHVGASDGRFTAL